MPEQISAIYHYLPDERERAQRMFLDAGLIDLLVDPDRLVGFQKIGLANEGDAQRLKYAAGANGLKEPLIQRAFAPTAKELAASPLLQVRALGPGASRGHPRKDTSYDESAACPQCGAGLVQKSPLRLRKTELPKKATSASIGDEILLHETIASGVKRSKPQGVGFRAVLGTEGEKLPWRQLVLDETMPPMLAGSRGMIRGRAEMEEPCTRCGRDGWFGSMHDPFIPVYSRSVLKKMPGAAWTSELFGTGAWGTPVHGKRWLAARQVIVRPDVYALLKSLKVRGLMWNIVRVE